jgi:hypothetical protein
MEITYLSIALFIVITIVYFTVPSIGKPVITLEILKDDSNELAQSHYTSSYTRLGIYFAIVLVSQYILNAVYIVNSCGGDVVTNFLNAFSFTIFPWVFIFGFMIMVLLMYPGFKSAFSDIIGYFVVAKSATEILNKILIDPNVSSQIDNSNMDATTKDNMKLTAQSVMKLLGNNAVLINQITPENFMDSWKKLIPLMKDDATKTNFDLQQQLLDISILRDNIGEGMWYIYTAIVIISAVAYKITSNNCAQSMFDIEAESLLRQQKIEKKMKNTKSNMENEAVDDANTVSKTAQGASKNVSGQAIGTYNQASSSYGRVNN